MPISVNLGKNLNLRLTKLSKLTGRTKTYYIREAIVEKLDEMEDIYLAERRIEKDTGKHWTLDALEKGSDVDD